MNKTITTLIVLPDRSFEKDFLSATLKHVNHHFGRNGIKYLCVNSMNQQYENLKTDLLSVSDGTIDLDTIDWAKSAKQIVLMTNIDGKSVTAKWNKSLGTDVYENYVHGYGGLRRILYRDSDKPCFKLDNKTNAYHIIASDTNDNLSFFPYLNFSHINSKFGNESSHEYGFRVPDDYQNLKHRDKKTRLIVFTGGSSCFGYGSFVGERFTDLLEKKLNSDQKDITYHVINFAFEGHQVLNEMITYMLFIMKLKPDMLVSYSGLNDLTMGMLSDNNLQKNYSISTQFYIEQMAARTAGYNKTLPCFSRNGFPVTSASIVIRSYYERIIQFCTMVENNGCKFYSILQPLVYSKKKMSKREKLLTDMHNSVQKGRSVNAKNGTVNPTTLKFLYEKFSLYAVKKDLPNFINLHSLMHRFGADVTLFNDSAHQSLLGEQIIADLLCEHLNIRIFKRMNTNGS